MPQVVDAGILQANPGTDTLPEGLQVAEALAGQDDRDGAAPGSGILAVRAVAIMAIARLRACSQATTVLAPRLIRPERCPIRWSTG